MRWVYKTVRVNVGLDFDHGLIERKLNESGREGWERVSTIRASDLLVACVLNKREATPAEQPEPPAKKGRKRKGE